MGIFNIVKFKKYRRSLRKNATFPEKILWQALRGKQMGYKFRRQHGIGPYIVDFYCPQLKLIIELDGSIHSIPTVQKKDAIREKYLAKMGFVIKRYLNGMVFNEKDSVLDDIYMTCQRLSVHNPEPHRLHPQFPLMLRGKLKRGLILIVLMFLFFAAPALAFDSNAIVNWQAPYATIYAGTYDNVVLDFSLLVTKPDTLKALSLINNGSATYTGQIKNLSLYVDNGDNIFQGFGQDKFLGNFYFSMGANSWYLENINEPVTDKLHLFVTAEAYALIENSGTMQMQISKLVDKNSDASFQIGDLGVFFDSGNNGPLDTALTNDETQVFSRSANDSFSPRLIFSNIKDGQIINNDYFVIKGLARDQGNHGLRNLALTINDQAISLDNYDPNTWTWSYNWSGIADGNYEIRASAYDEKDNFGQSEVIKVQVQKQTLASASTQIEINKNTILNTGLDVSTIKISLKDINGQALPNRFVQLEAPLHTLTYLANDVSDANGQVIANISSVTIGLKKIKVLVDGQSASDFMITVVNPEILANKVAFGDLVKGSLPAIYYLGADGKRYVFPSEAVYKTWYADFSEVKKISDDFLASLAIGGNITYKPGSKLVKIQTDAKVYAVDKGGVLRWLKSASLAKDLYGDNWIKSIKDVPDVFFSNYEIGQAIESVTDFDLASVTNSSPTINEDKLLF